ncbi:LMBR1-like membrane protein-domain-containing protein [Triangularia verruculosa]|uniref:LMBR1-like membrane protein-domain-containing protein n=1 Tax=Triangularia verruculosa TaxID=2587418 RepID=A0AAN7AX06_9PEZI|nr:LMBR1-like membrane protein-domain-containing protein [Triangularia verruculosa]
MSPSATTTAASPSPVLSETFSVLSLLTISIAVLLILRYYLPLRTTPAYLLVPVFFALSLPASIGLLVPIDLASPLDSPETPKGIWLPTSALRVGWRITYWLTFALTWFILPILAEYSDSGFREPKAKVLDSLRANAQYYAVVFGSGLIGFIYVLWSYGSFDSSLKGTIMALAYCWGLVLAIYLMGHGLVSIPRRLFRSADISGRLRRLQCHAPRIYEKMEDAEMELEDLELQVGELGRRKGGSAELFRDWIEELVDMISLEAMQPSNARRAVRGTGNERNLPNVITEKWLAELTRDLVRARHARERYSSEWNRLLEDVVRTRAILDSAGSKKLDFGKTAPGSTNVWERFSLFNPYTRHLFHYHVAPYLRMFFGGLLGLASVCIVWSELVKDLFPSLSVIRYTVIHHDPLGESGGQVGLAGQAIAAFWLLYMCAAALISITEVKVWRGRALVKRNTAPESAFWYASQVARLSVPLSYNFMTFLGSGLYKDTVFYGFLGKLIDLTPLGEWFNYLFPAFILLPVFATLFGLYGKVQNMVGFGAAFGMGGEDDDGEGEESFFGTGSWREGRDLIERELNGTSASVRNSRRADLAGLSANSNGRRNGPILSIPKSSTGSPGRPPTTPFATSPTSGSAGGGGGGGGSSRHQANTSARRAGRDTRGQVVLSNEGDDENFFEALGHRMKNTIDTFDAPDWFKGFGEGIKKPKWMGGDDSSRGSNTGEGGGTDIRRWFGGGDGASGSGGSGGGQGRIRL